MHAIVSSAKSNDPGIRKPAPGTFPSPLRSRWDKAGAAELLSASYWFEDLPKPLRDALLDLAEIRDVRRGSVLFRTGDRADGLYAVLDGDLRVFAPGENGERLFLWPLGPASWFGGADLADGEDVRRTYEVRSETASIVLFLGAAQFRTLTSADAMAARAFAALMSGHAAQAMLLAAEARATAPVRTARALLRLARVHGRAVGEGVELRIAVSQSDLAALAGISRQHVNELIGRWTENGLLTWKARRGLVLYPKRFRAPFAAAAGRIARFTGWM